MNLVIMPFVPETIQRELSGTQEWFDMKERCLFCDIYEEELIKRERGKRCNLIDENSTFAAFVPYFASHPFEVWIQSIDHFSSLHQLSDSMLTDLSGIFIRVVKRLHRALGPYAYIISFMNRPNRLWGINRGFWKTIDRDWHWRIRITPRTCLTNNTLEAFRYGTGNFVNPVTSETAAEYLRSV